MPTACSPQDCTSCTSMIGGRPGLYKYLLKIRAVIPLPPVSVRFRLRSGPPLSTKDPITSLPFPRCAPSCCSVHPSRFRFLSSISYALSTKNPVTSLPFPRLCRHCPRPFATCVCPIPVSVFHFPFFFLYGPTSFHQKSCHISPFSPAPPSVSRHTFLHFSSPLHRPFVLLHRCLSYPPCTLSFFHIIMYAHVCGCGSAASFASLQVSSPLYIIKGTENK